MLTSLLKVMTAVLAFSCAALAQPELVVTQSSERAVGLPKLKVELRLDGLYPKTMTVTPGAYQVLFINGVTSAPLTLGIIDGNAQGNSVAAKTENPEKAQDKKLMKVVLTPGRHKLVVEGQPNWISEIIVTPGKGN